MFHFFNLKVYVQTLALLLFEVHKASILLHSLSSEEEEKK